MRTALLIFLFLEAYLVKVLQLCEKTQVVANIRGILASFSLNATSSVCCALVRLEMRCSVEIYERIGPHPCFIFLSQWTQASDPIPCIFPQLPCMLCLRMSPLSCSQAGNTPTPVPCFHFNIGHMLVKLRKQISRRMSIFVDRYMCHPFSCMKPSLYHFVHVTWLLIWNSHHYSVRDRCWLFTVLSDEWILLCLRRLLKSSYKTNCNVLMHLGIGMKQKQTRIGILLFVWDIELKPTWLYWLQQQQIAAGMYIYSILYIRSIKKSENQVLLLMVQSREPAFFSLESQKVFLCFFPFHHIMRGITSIL